MSLKPPLLWVLVLLALVASSCSVSPSTERVTQGNGVVAPTPPSDAEGPVASSQPDDADLVAPTATPEPTQVPPTPIPPTSTVVSPTPTPVPTPTVVAEDNTPVVVESPDGWVITQGEIDSMMAFIEETHQLSFNAPVEVIVVDDIGAELASRIEIFKERDWALMQALGLDNGQDRDQANQVRRDRIRGVCCQFDGVTSAATEIEPTKLGTELIIVHELTHALHTQHDELFRGTSFETDESPPPFASAIEGVPQFVTFAYLDRAPAELQAEVLPELPIIRDDMLNLIAPGPARFLNFAYATGPTFVDAVVEARGIEGLSDLLGEPPTTTEQVLFPEKYLAGEEQGSVDAPIIPPGGQVRARGTIGAAMLMFLLADAQGDARARQLVKAWDADSYVVYEANDQLCLIANIVMDAAGAQILTGDAIVDSLRPNFPDAAVQITVEMITLTTCESPN